MSKTAWWILVIVIIVLVGGGIWWWSMMSQNANSSPAAATTQQVGSTNSGSTNQPSGDSDQDISQEMANINGQMNGLSSDSASINQGLNDQPVQQTQF